MALILLHQLTTAYFLNEILDSTPFTNEEY